MQTGEGMSVLACLGTENASVCQVVSSPPLPSPLLSALVTPLGHRPEGLESSLCCLLPAEPGMPAAGLPPPSYPRPDASQP